MSRRAAAVCAAWLILAGCRAASGTLPVDRFDARLRVDPAGSVHVQETFGLSVPASGGRFSRKIGAARTDGVAFVSSSVDGRTLAPGGDGAVRLEVTGGDGLEAVWTFGADVAGERELSFSYRADGAVAVQGRRGTLRQTVLAPARLFTVGRARIGVSVAPGLHVFEGTGIAEAGWTVSRTADGILAERADVAVDEAATVVVEMAIDPARVAEPVWQRDAEWGGQLVPAFISGGLFILTIGAGVLWIIRFQYSARGGRRLDDTARAAVHAGLRTTGYVAMALAAVLALITWLALSRFGAWPLAVPLSVFLVGFVFVSVSRRIV
jgi:hypothetical protein